MYSKIGLAMMGLVLLGGCGKQPQKEAPKTPTVKKEKTTLSGSTVTSTKSEGTVYASKKEVYKQACQAGDGRGCRDLSSLYEFGLGVKKDMKQALFYVEKGCELGYGASCNRAGNFYDYGYAGVKDKAKAAAYYMKGCELGYGTACNNIGNAYISGEGVVKNIDLAETYLNKALSLGENAYANLGFLYRVRGDDTKAIEYYTKGCQLKDKTACGNLAYVYKEHQEYTKSYNSYLKACHLTDGSACHSASMLLFKKKLSVPEMNKTMFRLDSNSCELKYAVGCSDVAYDYRKGVGVEVNPTKAKYYDKKACELGYTSSCNR